MSIDTSRPEGRYPTLTHAERVAVTALDHQVADVDAQIDALKVRRADLWADRGRILAAAAARAATPADIARVFLTTGERFNDLTAYVQSLHPTFGMPSRFGVERKAFWLAPEIRLFSSLVDLSPQNATALAQALREFAVTCAPDPIVLTDSDDPYWHEHHNGWHAARILGDAYFEGRLAYVYYTRPDADGRLSRDEAVLVDTRYHGFGPKEPEVLASGTLDEVLAFAITQNRIAEHDIYED